MKLKNIDKNLIENIVIILSIVLVIICIFMIITSSVSNPTMNKQVEWNGYKFLMEGDSNVEVNTDDTLKITSSYATHNIELKKTKDQTNFKKHFGSNMLTYSESEFNSTHKYISDCEGYDVIVPNDAVELKTAENGESHYEMKKNTEFIEITGENPVYIGSFMASHEKVK